MRFKKRLHAIYMDLRAITEPSFIANMVFFVFRNRNPKKRKKTSILMMTPRHGNLGDQAIALAELKYLKEEFAGERILEIAENQLYYLLKFCLLTTVLKKGILESDTIYLHGGGSFGDLYPLAETMRRSIIALLPKNQKIMFPQSLSIVTKEPSYKKEMSDFYNKHAENLVLQFRDEKSFHDAQSAFDDCDVRLTPDIVTYLSARIPNREKRSGGILYVIRSDVEKYHPAAEIDKMKTQIGYDSADCDTVVRGYIGRIRRRRKLSDFLKKYCRSAAVITDRFHGMVFAVITGTPCVVMRSLDHKVIEGYRWFRFLPYIRFANDASMVPEILQSLMKDTTKIEIPDYNKILCEKKDQNE